jgi:hypothetical protein
VSSPKHLVRQLPEGAIAEETEGREEEEQHRPQTTTQKTRKQHSFKQKD